MSIISSISGGRQSNVFDFFSLYLWDPFQNFPIDRPGFSKETTQSQTLALIGRRPLEAYVFKVGLLGLKEEGKVKMEEGNVLQISGEMSKESEENNNKWHRVERSSGKFLCRFKLPDNAKVDQVKAAMENGVLTITVPKEEMKKPEVKAIEISG